VDMGWGGGARLHELAAALLTAGASAAEGFLELLDQVDVNIVDVVPRLG
jgi:hypothetical protein